MNATTRRLRSLIADPGDAWLVCRMAPWALSLPVLKRVVRLETLARHMWAEPKRTGSEEARAKVVLFSQFLSRRRPPRSNHRCYERSLLAYRFLAELGADPRLVVALRKDDERGLAGHAWVTVEGVPVGESEPLDSYVPLVIYGRGGKRLD